MNGMEDAKVTEVIIGCAMKVHSVLGPAFLESVYKNALAHELEAAGVKVEIEKLIAVNYKGVVVGTFSADMVIEASIIVELKAVQALGVTHEVQIINYLTATGLDVGLLLNFGAQRLEFKRKTRLYRPKQIPESFTV